MGFTYIQPGHTLTLTAPYAVANGTGALIGSIFGVASSDVASGADGEFVTEGVWNLAKTSAQAWTQGQKIYWDDGNKRADSDGTVGPLIGVATKAASNPSTTGRVKLLGVPASASEGPQAAIADLTLTTLTDSPASADALRDELVAAWKVEMEGKINDILAALRARGDIAP